MAQLIGGAIDGFSKKREGRRLIDAGQKGVDNFRWDELRNVYDDVQVSTAGADIQREEAARTSASLINAGQAGGTRGIVGATGAVQASNNEVNRKIAANLEEQQRAIDFARAGDDAAIRGFTEKRQAEELAGYGNLIDVGRNLKAQGSASLLSAAGALDSVAIQAASGGFGGDGILGAIGGDKPKFDVSKFNATGRGTSDTLPKFPY